MLFDKFGYLLQLLDSLRHSPESELEQTKRPMRIRHRCADSVALGLLESLGGVGAAVGLQPSGCFDPCKKRKAVKSQLACLTRKAERFGGVGHVY